MTRSSCSREEPFLSRFATRMRREITSVMVLIWSIPIDQSNEYVLYYSSRTLISDLYHSFRSKDVSNDPQPRYRSVEDLPRDCRRRQFHPGCRGGEQDPVGGIDADEAPGGADRAPAIRPRWPRQPL